MGEERDPKRPQDSRADERESDLFLTARQAYVISQIECHCIQKLLSKESSR